MEINIGDLPEVILNLFLFWYGIAWNNLEDSGLAFGIWVRIVYNITIEQFLPTDSNWECPEEEVIERATYNNWQITLW